MARVPVQLTYPRLGPSDAVDALDAYVFGGLFAFPRPPRGIAPELVLAFLRGRVGPTDSAHVFERAVELARFYELDGLVAPLLEWVGGREPLVRAVRQVSRILELAGEVGEPEQVQVATGVLDQTAQRTLDAREGIALLDAYVALAPTARPDAVAQMLDRAIRAAQARERESTEQSIEYDRVFALRSIDLAQAMRCADDKARILAMPPAARRPLLVESYLGRGAFAHPYLQCLAARLLRFEAMQDDPEPVRAAFRQVLDVEAPAQEGDPFDAFVFSRACQAVWYLMGEVPARHRELYESIEEPALSFLWDDLPVGQAAYLAGGPPESIA